MNDSYDTGYDSSYYDDGTDDSSWDSSGTGDSGYTDTGDIRTDGPIPALIPARVMEMGQLTADM